MNKLRKLLAVMVCAALVLGIMPIISIAATDENVFYATYAGHSGSAKDDGLFIGCVGEPGTSSRAPYVDGVTGNQNTIVASSRIGAISFEIDGNIDPNGISAVMEVYVTSINENLGSNWMRIAAYETENPQLDYSIGGMDDSAYPAVNDDYSYDAAFWSAEQCSTSNLGWKTINVTRAVVNALNADGGQSETVTVVLRLQVPSAALNVAVDGASFYIYYR